MIEDEDLIGLKKKAKQKNIEGQLVEDAHAMFCMLMKYDVSLLATIIDDLKSEALEQILNYLTLSSHYTDDYKAMIESHYWQKINKDE